MRYEMSDFPPDPPSEAEDVRLTPASLRGHLQDLERRLFRARRVTIALQLTIALLLAALVVTLAGRKRDVLVEDDEGRPRIETYVSDREALLRIIDRDGVVRASFGESFGTSVLRLHGQESSQEGEVMVELATNPPRLALRHNEAEIGLDLGLQGIPWIRARGRDGKLVWSVREDEYRGVYEYRRRPPATLGQ